MIRALNIFLIWVYTFLGMYGFFAFSTWHWNPENWQGEARFFGFLFALVVAVVLTLRYCNKNAFKGLT
jgi:hypothetical protein